MIKVINIQSAIIMKTVGFIGFGKMAMAIVEGWNHCGLAKDLAIFAYAPNQIKLANNCQALGVTPCASLEEVCNQAEVIILACKPYQVEGVLDSISQELHHKFVICLAAGINYKILQTLIPFVHHVSIMPNTAMAVCAGIAIVEKNHSMDAQDEATFHELFAPLALIESVESSLFGIAGTISGCSPAFLGLYAEALADAGVKYGLSRPVAQRLAARAIYGAGAMLSQEDREPAIFKNEICSPGGTTIKGIVALEKAGFRKAVIEAIEAIEEKK